MPNKYSIVYFNILRKATKMSIIDKAVGNNIFSKTLDRLFSAGLSKGADPSERLNASAKWSVRDQATDFRVKVTLPSGSSLWQPFFGATKGSFETVYDDDGSITSRTSSNPVLFPLAAEGGVVFPLTPSIIVAHSASYNPLTATHSNYPFYAYQHSEVPSFTIVGEFPVQNAQDAQYWVAMLHFFRSVTKMFFGSSVDENGNADNTLKGNPPPILTLNGYGDYVFNNVPVVITNFTCDMRADVDYICTTQKKRPVTTLNKNVILNPSTNKTWAPTLSQITLQLQPVYSRESVKKFNMKDFVNGRLNGGDGKVGYI